MEIPARDPFLLEITVGEEDIDAQNHASNVTVVKWMSRAAWAHSRALGWDLEAYRQIGGWWVVRRHEIDYLASARLGESLICATWPSGLGKATAERRHVIYRPADEAIIARGLNVWAFVDMQSARPRRIPPGLRKTFHPDRFKLTDSTG